MELFFYVNDRLFEYPLLIEQRSRTVKKILESDALYWGSLFGFPLLTSLKSIRKKTFVDLRIVFERQKYIRKSKEMLFPDAFF
jgi:hypothetical protein